MSLTDADLDQIARGANTKGASVQVPPHKVAALVKEYRALRARVAGTDGPDQGDPAATRRANALLREVLDARFDDGTPVAEMVFATRPDLRDRLRAVLPPPGAVAAAPPGDEEAECDGRCLTAADVGVPEAGGMYAVDDECSLHGAPPAGHEDEAAVESIVLDHLDRWQEWDAVGVEAFACDLDAALAAARGPRTPDPGTAGTVVSDTTPGGA